MTTFDSHGSLPVQVAASGSQRQSASGAATAVGRMLSWPLRKVRSLWFSYLAVREYTMFDNRLFGALGYVDDGSLWLPSEAFRRFFAVWKKSNDRTHETTPLLAGVDDLSVLWKYGKLYTYFIRIGNQAFCWDFPSRRRMVERRRTFARSLEFQRYREQHGRRSVWDPDWSEAEDGFPQE